jgi:hypothetical protein
MGTTFARIDAERERASMIVPLLPLPVELALQHPGYPPRIRRLPARGSDRDCPKKSERI